MVFRKKAFTIIEVVYVILIIGILSAVVVPRLMLTRDDAKVAVAFSDFGRLLNELTVYYTTYGYFDSNLSLMTTVEDVNYSIAWNQLRENATITYYTETAEGSESCLNIYIQNQDGNITISKASQDPQTICQALHKISTEKNLLSTKLLLGNNIF